MWCMLHVVAIGEWNVTDWYRWLLAVAPSCEMVVGHVPEDNPIHGFSIVRGTTNIEYVQEILHLLKNRALPH